MRYMNKERIIAVCLSLLAALPCAMAQGYKLGDVVTNDDGSRGVVFYVKPDGSGGWMVALNDASSGCPWGISDDIPALTNQDSNYQQLLSDTDGYGNTEKIRAYQSNSSEYAAGKADFNHGWYLPSAGQLRKLFGNLPQVSGAIAAAGGIPLSSHSGYWSSTEHDASQAWVVETRITSDNGFFFSVVSKTDDYGVRAIHDFEDERTMVYDTALYYYWNTGATTPYIDVSPTQTTTYTVTATTEFGCSTTAEHIIFVNSSGSEHIYDTVCAGYAYNGYGFALTPEQTQTQGEATFSIEIGGGDCETTLTLHLYKILSARGPNINASICGDEPYHYNSVDYSVPGTYHQYFTAASGCDSIVTLNLKHAETYEDYLDTVHCGAYWFNGQPLELSGNYEWQFVSVDGCDSIVHLQLTVEPLPDSLHMEGPENVFVATDLVTGVYHYEADSVPNAIRYEWSLTDADWLMDTLGTSCNLTVLYPGTGILTLRAWSECGFTEVQKTITAGYFDVDEHEAIHVNVYPNPAQNKAIVESEGIMSVRIFSMMGQLLQEINGNGDDRLELSLKDYVPSPYLLKVKTRNGVANVKLNVVR